MQGPIDASLIHGRLPQLADLVCRTLRDVFGRALLFGLLAYCAWTPLQQVLHYPDRLSVLSNLQTDAEAYFNLGRSILEHGSIGVLPPRHPPVWPAVLALTFSLTGVSYVAAKVVLWMSFLGSIIGCAWLARRTYGPVAAWTSALLSACSPALHGYVGTVQYEVFTGALVIAMLVLAVWTTESATTGQRIVRSTLTGVVAGVVVLTREPFAVTAPLVALWLAQQLARTGQRTAWRLAALVLLIAALPPVTWSIAQSVRHGQFVTISEKGPIVVELGHNPRANGTYNAPLVGIGQPTGLEYALANPGREVVLSIRKVLYFWGVLRDGWNVPRPSATYLWRATTGIVPYDLFGALARGGWLLAFFVVSLWVLGRAGLARWWLFPAIVLAIMAVHIATLSSHRFAVSVLPIVFVLISGPVALVAMHALRLLRSRLILAAALVLVSLMTAMQFQAWPLQRELTAAELDGLDADNEYDPVAGTVVRMADARRGSRPIALLADEFLARGTVRVRARMRRLGEPTRDHVAAVRMSLVGLDGTPACVQDITPGELASDQFTPHSMTCEILRDSVATLAVYSMGYLDVAVQDIVLEWR